MPDFTRLQALFNTTRSLLDLTRHTASLFCGMCIVGGNARLRTRQSSRTKHPRDISGRIIRPFGIPDASFDLIFSTLMLHHLPSPMQLATAAEMRRVLRPGGRIVMVDLQRPSKISVVFSHIGLIHLFRSRATMPNWQNIEELLTKQSVQLAGRQAVWGGTVCALVGRTAAET
jgi:SAM-dependent methyltransferase